jgi:hypothetical protein
MPKSLNEFSLADWCRLRPLTQGVKTARYKVIDRAYRRCPATSGDVASVARSVSGHRLLVTIAFDDPELIWWQTRLLRHYVRRTFHLIVDNTTTDEVALEIRRVASEAGAAYLRAPANPWSGKAASRSHGIALNWTWQNVIRSGEPAAFGFLDHDIFPTALDDPFAPLAEQDVYGVIRRVGSRWFLWAGFCMFRFAAVRIRRSTSVKIGSSGSIPEAGTGVPSTEELSARLCASSRRISSPSRLESRSPTDHCNGAGPGCTR